MIPIKNYVAIINWGIMSFSGPKENCGVVAVSRQSDECADWIIGTEFELRHRGHESWGMSTYSDKIETKKYPGIVPEEDIPDENKTSGRFGIGHVRYGTAGAPGIAGAQPIEIDAPYGKFAIAQNGTIWNANEIKKSLAEKDIEYKTDTDTELIGHLIAEGDDVIDGYKKASKAMKGAWCLTILDEHGVYAMRDPHGIRPLTLMKKDDDYIIASEPGIAGVLGLELLRDISPGEIIYIDTKGKIHGDSIEADKPAYCAFCRAYFARPDSLIDTTVVGNVRIKLGANIAEIDDTPSDFIQGVPDSGCLYAQGYHSKTGNPMGTVILRKRHYRTFITPGDRLSKVLSKYILLPFRNKQSGKFFEDTIVRGNTLKGLVEWLRRAAKLKEVHIRVGTPPVRKPCPLGVDMQTKTEFAIENCGDVEGVREHIGADSLLYQTEDGFFDGLGISGIPPEYWCTACWGIGNYPDDIPENFERF